MFGGLIYFTYLCGMKYTRYLLKEDFINLDSLVSDNKYLRDVSAILPCVIGIVGVVVISTALPIVFTVDMVNKLRR